MNPTIKRILAWVVIIAGSMSLVYGLMIFIVLILNYQEIPEDVFSGAGNAVVICFALAAISIYIGVRTLNKLKNISEPEDNNHSEGG